MKRILLCAVAACAATAASAAIPPAYQAHLPPEHHAGAIDYITGGNAHDEALSIRRAAQEYPLELVFAEQGSGRNGGALNVPITITDAAGRMVFTGPSEGPYFLARLPAGDYTITTSWGPWTFSRAVAIIPGDRERVVFEWKKAPAVANG